MIDAKGAVDQAAQPDNEEQTQREDGSRKFTFKEEFRNFAWDLFQLSFFSSFGLWRLLASMLGLGHTLPT